MLLYALMKIIFTLYIYSHIYEKLKLPENVYGANTKFFTVCDHNFSSQAAEVRVS